MEGACSSPVREGRATDPFGAEHNGSGLLARPYAALCTSFWEMMCTRLSGAQSSSSPETYMFQRASPEASVFVTEPNVDVSTYADVLMGQSLDSTPSLYDQCFIRLHGYIADNLWSLAQNVFVMASTGSVAWNLSHRPAMFTVQRLCLLEQYALKHIITHLRASPWGVAVTRKDSSWLPTPEDLLQFVQRPTSLFVLLEIAYIFEACHHLRETLRGNVNTVSSSLVAKRPLVYHPLLSSFALSPPQSMPMSDVPGGYDFRNMLIYTARRSGERHCVENVSDACKAVGVPSSIVVEAVTSAFLAALFYPLQDIVRQSIGESTVGPRLVEKCLVLYLLTRVPAGASLKRYIPEMIPLLLSVLANEDEITAETAHRLLFTVFKAFHRDFDAGEGYLQLATYVYTQALNACTVKMKPWYSVVAVEVVEKPSASYSCSSVTSGCPSFEPAEMCLLLRNRSEASDPALAFLSLPGGTSLQPGRTSLKVVVEIPLMVMLLMQLHSSFVRLHAPVILERLLQFISFIEPHKNYKKVEDTLRRGDYPSESIFLLDFKTQRDLLDAQVKSIAFVSFFLRGSPGNGVLGTPGQIIQSFQQSPATSGEPLHSNPLSNNTAFWAGSFTDISATIMEYLRVAPYQVGLPYLARYICLVSIEPTSCAEPLQSANKRIKLVRRPSSAFFNVDYDNLRSIYCRREILVSLRSILRSSEFRLPSPAGRLSQTLCPWIYLGTGLTAADYLKPFICQLRIELLNFLRTSDVLHRVLANEVSTVRAFRAECVQAHSRAQVEAFDAAARLSPTVRAARLTRCFRWGRRARAISSGRQEGYDDGEAHVVDCSVSSGATEFPQDHNRLVDPEIMGYGDIRALLLLRAAHCDLQRTAVLPSDKLLPLSVVSHIVNATCCDLHDSSLPLYTQTHLANSLIILAEWVDRLSVDPRARGTHTAAGVIAQFMDQKEVADIHRRILEACTSKLWMLQRTLPQLLEASHCGVSYKETVSAGGRFPERVTPAAPPVSSGAAEGLDDIPDLFSTPRQAAWALPPLLFGSTFPKTQQQQQPTAHYRVDVLKDVRILSRTLCQAVRTASFLLTVVGVPTADAQGPWGGKEQPDVLRLQHAVPLADSDYQMVRDAFFYGLRLAALYGNAMSATLLAPHKTDPEEPSTTEGFWGCLHRSVLMNPSSLSWLSWCAMTPNVQGHVASIQLERQLLLIQQDSRELLESAVSILSTFHPAIAHRFLSSEFSTLIALVEQYPSLLVLFEILAQNPQTVQTLTRVLPSVLLPQLPSLTDTLLLGSVLLPEYLGNSIAQQSRRRKNESPTAVEPSSKVVDSCGHLIYTNDEKLPSPVCAVLEGFQKAPSIPVDLFETPWEQRCPSRLVVDPDVDCSVFERVSLQWNSAGQGFYYTIKNVPPSSASPRNDSNPLPKQRDSSLASTFLSHYHPKTLHVLPDSIQQVPKSVTQPDCWHRSCPYKSGTSFVAGATFLPETTPYGVRTQSDTPADALSGHALRRHYRYIARCSSYTEASELSVHINTRKEWLRKSRTVLVSSCSDSSRLGTKSSSTNAASAMSAEHVSATGLPSYIIALDPTLETSERWLFESSEAPVEASVDFVVTQVVGIEGCFPGVESLTHVATGHARLPYCQILLYLWRLYFTLLAHNPLEDKSTAAFFEQLIPSLVVLIAQTARPSALLNVLSLLVKCMTLSTYRKTELRQNARDSVEESTKQEPSSAQFIFAQCFPSAWFLSACSTLTALHSHDKCVKETLAEIALMIPVTAASVVLYPEFLAPSLLTALSSRDASINNTALRVLDTMIDTLHSDTTLSYFTSSLQPDYDVLYRSPLFSILLSLVEPVPRPLCLHQTSSFASEAYIGEFRNPATGVLLHHDELQWDLDNTNSRNALSAYACRLLGKLGSVARLLAREPPLLDCENALGDNLSFGFSLKSSTSESNTKCFNPTTAVLYVTKASRVSASLFDVTFCQRSSRAAYRHSYATPLESLGQARSRTEHRRRASLHVGYADLDATLRSYNLKPSALLAPNVHPDVTYPYRHATSLFVRHWNRLHRHTSQGYASLYDSLIDSQSCVYLQAETPRSDVAITSSTCPPGARGLVPSWTQSPSSSDHQGVTIPERSRDPMLTATHPSVLRAYALRQAEQLLGRALLEMFDLDTQPDKNDLFSAVASDATANITESGRGVYAPCNSALFKLLTLVLKGLLNAASQPLKAARKRPRRLLLFVGSYIARLLVRPSFVCRKGSIVTQPLNPLEFVAALVSCFDFAQWGPTIYGIRLLKHIVGTGLQLLPLSDIWDRPPFPTLGNSDMLRPILQLCYGSSFTVAAAASWTLRLLLELYPRSWAEYHFECIASALSHVVRQSVDAPGLPPIIPKERRLAVSVASEALERLCCVIFRGTLTPYEPAMGSVVSWKTLCSETEASRYSFFFRWVLRNVVKDTVHACAVVREHSYWLLQRLAFVAQLSVAELLTASLPEQQVAVWGFGKDYGQPQTGGSQYPSPPGIRWLPLERTPVLLCFQSIAATTVGSTLLGQMLRCIERASWRFHVDHAEAVVDCLAFIVSQQTLPLSPSFLLRCTSVARATYVIAETRGSGQCSDMLSKDGENASPTATLPKLIRDELRSTLIIRALRLAKLVELHATKQQQGVFPMSQAISSAGLPHSAETQPLDTAESSGTLEVRDTASSKDASQFIVTDSDYAATSSAVFCDLGIRASASLFPEDAQYSGLGLLLDAAGDVDVHVARAAQHSLLVLGGYEASRLNASGPVSLSSMCAENFLFAHLKTSFGILGDPARRTASHFFALARVSYLFKETFHSPSVSSRLVDVAFGLCDVCDGLVKQLTNVAVQSRGGNPTQRLAATPLTVFSPSLTMDNVPAVAAGVLACFAGLHPSAFASRPLSRSALRLVVGLLDFVDLTLVQAQHQARFFSSTAKAASATGGIAPRAPLLSQLSPPSHQQDPPLHDSVSKQQSLSTISVISDINEQGDQSCIPRVRLHDAFIDFCIAHPHTIVNTVWARTETTTPVTNSVSTVTSLKLSGPFMLARGKTAAFMFRALQDPRAAPLRNAMASKASLMSRILKERLDLHYPGFVFYPYHATLSKDMLRYQEHSSISVGKRDASGFQTPSPAAKRRSSSSDQSCTTDFGGSASATFRTSAETPYTTTTEPESLVAKRRAYLAWLANDTAGSTSEALSSVTVDILTVVIILHQFDGAFLWNDWLMHCWVSLLLHYGMQQRMLPCYAELRIQPPKSFHLFPYALDVDCPWTSTHAFPLVHCMLDTWSVAAGFFFQSMTQEDIMGQEHVICPQNDGMNSSEMLSGPHLHHVERYLRHAEVQQRPVAGLSWCSTLSMDVAGSVVWSDFQSVFHTPLGVSLALTLSEVLRMSFTSDAIDAFNAAYLLVLTQEQENSVKHFPQHYNWVALQTVILQLKLVIALLLPLALPVSQDFSFLEVFFAQLWAHHAAGDQEKPKTHPYDVSATLGSFLPSLLRLFFRFLLFNPRIPSAVKVVVARYVIVPVLALYCSKKPFATMPCLDAHEFALYFFEISELSPDPFSRRVATDPTIDASITTASLNVCDDALPLLAPRLVSQYFEHLLSRCVPFVDEQDEEQQLLDSPSDFWDIKHLEDNEALQLELLRVLRYLAELASPVFVSNSVTEGLKRPSRNAFVWNLCVSEHLVIRHWAYYYVSTALCSYPWMLGPVVSPLPSTTMLDFMVTLFQCPQLETRILTRASLQRFLTSNIYTPETLTAQFILPLFFSLSSSIESSMPHVQILQRLCQCIVRHHDELYSCRHLLLPPCASALGRVALNAGGETRRVILDLVHVILVWELRSFLERCDVSQGFEALTERISESALLETCGYYSMKAALTSTNDSTMISRGVCSMIRCLVLCPKTPIRYLSVVKCLSLHPSFPHTSAHLGLYLTKRTAMNRVAFLVLHFFHILVTFQDQTVIEANLGLLMQTLDPIWESTDIEIIRSLARLVEKIVQLIPPPPLVDLTQITKVVPATYTSAPIHLFWARLVQVVTSGLINGACGLLGDADADAEALPRFLVHPPAQRSSTSTEGSDAAFMPKATHTTLHVQYKMMNGLLESLDRPFTLPSTPTHTPTTATTTPYTPNTQTSQQQRLDVDPHLACHLLHAMFGVSRHGIHLHVVKQWLALSFGTHILNAARGIASLLVSISKDTRRKTSAAGISCSSSASSISTPSWGSHSVKGTTRLSTTVLRAEHVGGSAVEIVEHRSSLLIDLLRLAGCFCFFGDPCILDATVPTNEDWAIYAKHIKLEYQKHHLSLKSFMQRAYFALLIDIPQWLPSFGLIFEILKLVQLFFYGPPVTLSLNWNLRDTTDTPSSLTAPSSSHTSLSFSTEYDTWDYLDIVQKTSRVYVVPTKDADGTLTKYKTIPASSCWHTIWNAISNFYGRRFLQRSPTDLLNQLYHPSTDFGVLEVSYILHCWSELVDAQPNGELHLSYYNLVFRVAQHPTRLGSDSLTELQNPEPRPTSSFFNLGQATYSNAIGIWVSHVEHRLRSLVPLGFKPFKATLETYAQFVNLTLPILLGALSPHPDIHLAFTSLLLQHLPKDYFGCILSFLSLPELQRVPQRATAGLLAELLISRHPQHCLSIGHLGAPVFPSYTPVAKRPLTNSAAVSGQQLDTLQDQKKTIQPTIAHSNTESDLYESKFMCAEQQWASYCSEAKSYLQPLRYFAFGYASVTKDLLSSILPMLWSSLTIVEQLALAEAVVTLLSYAPSSRKTASVPSSSTLSWTEVGHCSQPVRVPPRHETFFAAMTSAQQTRRATLEHNEEYSTFLKSDQEKSIGEMSTATATATLLRYHLHGLEGYSHQTMSTADSATHQQLLESGNNKKVSDCRATATSHNSQAANAAAMSTPTAQGEIVTGPNISQMARRIMQARTATPITRHHALGISLLNALRRCSPPILYPPEILRHVAVHSRCWHLALHQLIDQLFALPKCESVTAHANAIIELCHTLYDADTAHAIASFVASTQESRTLLGHVVMARWSSAQDGFNYVLKRFNQSTCTDVRAAQQCIAALQLGRTPLIPLSCHAFPDIKNYDPSDSAPSPGCPQSDDQINDPLTSFLSQLGVYSPQRIVRFEDEDGSDPFKRSDYCYSPFKLRFPETERNDINFRGPLDLHLITGAAKHELGMWTSDWIRASTQLNQWNSLSEVSSLTNVPLSQEAKSKLLDWTGVERLMSAYGVVTPQAAMGLFYSKLQKTASELPFYVTRPSPSTTMPFEASQGKLGSSLLLNTSVAEKDQTSLTASPTSQQPFSTPHTPQLGPITAGTATANASAPYLKDTALHFQIDTMQELLTLCQQLVVVAARGLPTIPGPAHLQTFLAAQLHVETSEGFRWVLEFLRKIVVPHLSPSTFEPQYALAPREAVDNRALITTWRARLLSDADDMRSWSDLLVWRNCLFTVVQSLISYCPVLPQDQQALWATYQQDVAWTILKFAHVAHWPHRLPDVAFALLFKLHSLPTFFTSPAYTSDYLLTVIRCAKLCQTPQEKLAGLNLLRAVNIRPTATASHDLLREQEAHIERAMRHDYPDSLDKLRASLCVSKARILMDFPDLPNTPALHRHVFKTQKELDDSMSPSQFGTAELHSTPDPFSGFGLLSSPTHNLEQAYTDVATALDICPALGRAWATWALLSDRTFSSGGYTNGETDATTHIASGDIQYAASAITAYLMATYLSPYKLTHYLSRVLWLLVYDNDQHTLSRTFGRFTDLLVPSVWLPWIQQLIAGLERQEAIPCYALLHKLFLTFPQAIYYDIRSVFMEKAILLHSCTNPADTQDEEEDQDIVLTQSLTNASDIQPDLSTSFLGTPSRGSSRCRTCNDEPSVLYTDATNKSSTTAVENLSPQMSPPNTAGLLDESCQTQTTVQQTEVGTTPLDVTDSKPGSVGADRTLQAQSDSAVPQSLAATTTTSVPGLPDFKLEKELRARNNSNSTRTTASRRHHGSSPHGKKAPWLSLLQTEELCHQLLYSAYESTAATVCAAMDQMMDIFADVSNTLRIEDVCVSLRYLATYLIDLPPVSAETPRVLPPLCAAFLFERIFVGLLDLFFPLHCATDPPKIAEATAYLMRPLWFFFQKDFCQDTESLSTFFSLLEAAHFHQIDRTTPAAFATLLAGIVPCTKETTWKDVLLRLHITGSTWSNWTVETCVPVLRQWIKLLESKMHALVVDRRQYIDTVVQQARLYQLPSIVRRLTTSGTFSATLSYIHGAHTALIVPGATQRITDAFTAGVKGSRSCVLDRTTEGFELTMIRIAFAYGSENSRTDTASRTNISDQSIPNLAPVVLFETRAGLTMSYVMQRHSLFQGRSQQRMVSVLNFLNGFLVTGKDARHRDIRIPLCYSVPVQPYLHLIDSTHLITLESLYRSVTESSLRVDQLAPSLVFSSSLRRHAARLSRQRRRPFPNRLKQSSQSQQTAATDKGMLQKTASNVVIETDGDELALKQPYDATIFRRATEGSESEKLVKDSGNADDVAPTERSASTRVDNPYSRDLLLRAARHTYKDMCSWVSPGYLATYLHTCFPDPQRLALARKRLATDLGVWCLLSYVLFSADPFTLDNLAVNFQKARFYMIQGLYPHLRADTLTISHQLRRVVIPLSSGTTTPPFRLTPNLVGMIGLTGRLGELPGSMLSVLMALALPHHELALQSLLNITIRDDLYTITTLRALSSFRQKRGNTDDDVYRFSYRDALTIELHASPFATTFPLLPDTFLLRQAMQHSWAHQRGTRCGPPPDVSSFSFTDRVLHENLVSRQFSSDSSRSQDHPPPLHTPSTARKQRHDLQGLYTTHIRDKTKRNVQSIMERFRSLYTVQPPPYPHPKATTSTSNLPTQFSPTVSSRGISSQKKQTSSDDNQNTNDNVTAQQDPDCKMPSQDNPRSITPPNSLETSDFTKIRAVIDAATHPHHLGIMQPSWVPWF